VKAIYTWHSYKKNKWVSKDFEILTLLTSIKKSLDFFSNVELYTDSESFKELTTYDLSQIKIIIKDRVEHELWVIDKVNTYVLQTEPFIHIDCDFIFLKAPKTIFLQSEIGFQSVDKFTNEIGNCYIPRINNLLQCGAPIYYNIEEAYNFGVYLCNNLEINTQYCKKVFKLSDFILDNIAPVLAYNIVAEQYVMRSLLESKKIWVRTLTEEYEDNEDFLHLMHNKKNKNYCNKIKELYE
jgi:hypothetical protein